MILVAQLCCAQTHQHVLFVGNSLTYSHNLPGLTTQIASSKGDSMTHFSNTPGGADLSGLYLNPTRLAILTQEPWDVVVFQGQSTEAGASNNLEDLFLLSVCSLVDRASRHGSKAVLYQTYANNNPIGYLQLQEKISRSYHYAGNLTHTAVAPVGDAWLQAYHDDPNPGLHTGDDVHPTIKGAYLSACVFYATLFCNSPIGAWYPAGISSTEATYLQQLAHNQVFLHLSENNLEACSPSVLVPEPMPTENIWVYPNPAQETVRLRLPNATTASLTVMDWTGRVLKNHWLPAQFEHHLNWSNLPSGTYHVRVQTKKEVYHTTIQKIR